MNAFTLRAVSDEELEDLCLRLERQVRDMAEASTSLGRKLHCEYSRALHAARLERDRRACEL